MKTTTHSADNVEAAFQHLNDHGYAVIQNVLSETQVEILRDAVETLYTAEKEAPFDPPDGPVTADDAAIEKFLNQSYTVSQEELERLLRRIRHTRAQNHGTPWPVTPDQVNKLFLHLPTRFDQDRSRRIWNLPNKGDVFVRLIEHPITLGLVRRVLGEECTLSDCSATSIGAHTEGGAWHVDVPLGQLPEPLPDFPLTTQNIFLLDDFTTENGATQVVPGSHKTRKKPEWKENTDAAPVALTAPAGSVVMWLSNTWHRSGPNSTDEPRRGVICYYSRSWIKPFNDYRAGIAPDTVARFSPTARYLLGFSANGPVRG